MDFGIFNIPYSLEYAEGNETSRQVIDWDLQVTKWADENDYSEAWFAEHFTIGHEGGPAPELMIAAASQITERIHLGAGAHLLPYHHPAGLAHRMMWLDHMTGGRYIAGVAPGAFPTDAQLFDTGENNPAMMKEALEIIRKIWMEEGPWRVEGEFWTVDMPGYTKEWAGPLLKPLTKPHPPLAFVGMSAKSGSMSQAGALGAIPISQTLGVPVLKQHWEAYAEAAEEAGITPSRADWHIARDVLVADTDEEAFDLIRNGGMGRLWHEHNLPLFRKFGITSLIADIPDDELTVEWMIQNFWLCGSPDTVVEKITAFNEEVGGFGTSLAAAYDYRDNQDAYRHHFELMKSEVIPRVAGINAKTTVGQGAAS